ncbi:hypothetical protein COT03_00005, partial [Candidatus Shapirobacteria bacterium CG07_land_8_20_14_0_80_39_18]
ESSKIRLSVALATLNEERSLGNCLDSVKGLADEVVVVDGSSSDRTVEIAKFFGAKVIVTDNKPIFHINKQQAIDECQGEWILQLDADEVVTPELAEEIRQVVEKDTDLPVAYWIKRKKMFLGRWIKKGGQYPDPVIRLFRRKKAFLPCKSVHEQMVIEGEISWLKNPMLHFPTPSFSVYITKDNRYSTLTALQMKEKNLSLGLFDSMIQIILTPLKVFLSIYIWHKGFLDGFPGFVFALYSGLHQMTAYIKYWEIKTSGKIDIQKDWV